MQKWAVITGHRLFIWTLKRQTQTEHESKYTYIYI